MDGDDGFGIGQWYDDVGLTVRSGLSIIFLAEDAAGTDLLYAGSDGSFGVGPGGYDSNAGLGVRSADPTLLQVQSSDGTDRFSVNSDGTVGVGGTYDNVALNVTSDKFFALFAEKSDGTDQFAVLSGGQVAIGPEATNVNVVLSIIGDDPTEDFLIYAKHNNAPSRFFSVDDNADVFASSYDTTSDARLKDQIEDLPYGLAEVMAMQPRAFVFKDQPETPKIGLIAQELAEVVPEVVSETGQEPDPDAEGAADGPYLAVAYSELVPVLIEAIQEQQAIIDELSARLDAAGL
jgi:hypothetical protein